MTAHQPLHDELARLCFAVRRTVQIMEVCGTHTVSLFRSGLRSLLPPNLRLISGPGCPVCVTAQRHIDAAAEIAARPGVILATYGDMLRVPGRHGSLELTRGAGARVMVVHSALRALRLASENPRCQVVFLGVGFETTAPATAAAVLEAHRTGIENFSVLMCHKRVVPAMLAILADKTAALDGFLCPGHVSVIIGASAYRPIVSRHAKPCVVAGFEPRLMLLGLVKLMRQVAGGACRLENAYEAVVNDAGNRVARRLLARAFVVADTHWRSLGLIPGSGYELAAPYRHFDALNRFNLQLGDDVDHPACRCGDVIRGRVTPPDCALFGSVCTPLTPLGPCMVSSEGTCAAWHKYAGPTARGVAV